MALFIKRMASNATKIILIVGCIVLATEIKAENGLFGYEMNPYSANNPKLYKPDKNSSMANKKLAPAYRKWETPRFAVKTNILFDITTSMNLGVEFSVGRKMTLDVLFTLNPWMYNKEENTKFKFLLFQPELRYWTCEAFNGQFFGLHGHYAYYNVSHLPKPFSETMNLYRFEGQLAGAGVSYGYHWLISPRWSFEAEIGAGYARLWYDKYPCQTCAKTLTSENKNYWGVTRAGLSLIYLF